MSLLALYEKADALMRTGQPEEVRTSYDGIAAAINKVGPDGSWPPRHRASCWIDRSHLETYSHMQ